MPFLDSVNGHDAADGNPYVPAVVIAGHVGNAVQFNGVESTFSTPIITIQHAADFNQAQVSVSCWIKLANKDSSVTMIAKGADYSLQYDTNTDRIIGIVGAGGTVAASTFGSPPINTWIFVTWANDTVGGNLTIQVNNGAVDSVSAGPLPSGTDALLVGTNAAGAAFSIDDLRFFADILSAGEVTGLYNGGAGSAAAVGDETHWWTFNALVGGVYPDSAGSQDGTPASVSISSTPGVVGNAVLIQSVDPRNWLIVADSPDLRANGTDSFSFVFWLYVFGYPASRSSILFKTDAGDSDYNIELFSGGTLGFSMAGADFAYPEADLAGIPLNQWVMITAIFEYGVGLRLQMNLDAPVSTAYLLGCMANNSPEPLIYGRQLNGAIDELYFCKEVLTVPQIEYFYNGGAGRALYP